MKKLFQKLGFYLCCVLLIMQLTSCESNFKEVQKINFSEFVPSGEAENLNLKYTDSGRIKSVLISPKMLDYATVEFPFISFPDGIDLTMYDQFGRRTFVKSQKAINYKSNQIIDLIGNVTITNEQTNFYQSANGNQEGFYEFKDVRRGVYKLKFDAGGFASPFHRAQVATADAASPERLGTDTRPSAVPCTWIRGTGVIGGARTSAGR